MRHADSKTTTSTYAHLDVEDLRDGVNAITPALHSVAAMMSAQLAACTESNPFGPPLVQGEEFGPTATEGTILQGAESAAVPRASDGFVLGRPAGFEPATPGFTVQCSTS